jgi:class 3 adenylate cyclase
MADDDRPLPGRTEGTEDVQIRTFLIADVRGYTLFTQERGDGLLPSSRPAAFSRP